MQEGGNSDMEMQRPTDLETQRAADMLQRDEETCKRARNSMLLLRFGAAASPACLPACLHAARLHARPPDRPHARSCCGWHVAEKATVDSFCAGA